MRLHISILAIFTLVLFSSQSFAGEAFQECPSQAFLFQGNPVRIYGLDLLTGDYELIQSDVGLPGNINAVGFSFDDRYLYGFNTSRFTVVRLDRNLIATELPVTGLPENITFYVGDVSMMTYWLYRKNVGLYRINLDETKSEYLKAIKIVGADVSLTLTDFAFHPSNGEMFAVDNKSGRLYQISMTDGQATLIGETGVTGTFGAGYFDVNGFYYMSRNSDGEIFRIDLSESQNTDVTAEFFAQGPLSSQNDGARCAYAPITSLSIDWGDAPDNYKTTLLSNGPRHSFDESLRLGQEITDGEYNANVWPLSDDDDLYDDEGGIRWVDDWVAGLHQTLSIDVVGAGYINAWVDWNQNGVFDIPAEQIVQDRWFTQGEHSIPVLIPSQASEGDTWLRVRLSRDSGILPTGGAVGGEVEDHALFISKQPTSVRYFPSATGWTTLAFEDQWPQEGDYDFNDVVLHYRLGETLVNGEIRRVDITIQVVALGASYRSGFAVSFPGLERVDLNEQLTIVTRERQSTFDKTKIHPRLPIAVVSNDLLKMSEMECTFLNTAPSCVSNEFEEVTLSLVLNEGANTNTWPAFPYDPFIFGTAGHWRGPWLENAEKNELEIHLADVMPTPLANESLWQAADDDSQPTLGRFYRTSENLPWALLFAESWRYPKEGISLVEAYPDFRLWAESNGELSKDWFKEINANINVLY